MYKEKETKILKENKWPKFVKLIILHKNTLKKKEGKKEHKQTPSGLQNLDI